MGGLVVVVNLVAVVGVVEIAVAVVSRDFGYINYYGPGTHTQYR